jgi:carotenoid cleavage dioxygenase-like enzyme
MMHDFAITRNYIVFMDHPLVFRPDKLFSSPNSMPFEFERERGSRYGMLSKDATSESDIHWFEFPPHFAFHAMNAWEEVNYVLVALYVANPTLGRGIGCTLWFAR